MKQLTVRLKPYGGEALSSFLIRLAKANGMELLALWRMVKTPGTHCVQLADLAHIDFYPENAINLEYLGKLISSSPEHLLSGSFFYAIEKFLPSQQGRARFLSGVIQPRSLVLSNVH